jgi:hypothetical protein
MRSPIRLLVGISANTGLALLVDRRVVERVHEHLVEAALDVVAVLAPHAHQLGELEELRDAQRLLLVVADQGRVDPGAPRHDLLEAEDVARQEPGRGRRQLAGIAGRAGP